MTQGKLWRPDPDPDVAALEGALYRLGAGYLLRVQRDVHQALSLPSLPVAAVREAYHARRLAKADADHAQAWSRASQLFAQAQALRARQGVVPAAWLSRLADAATHKWFAEGRLASRAERLVVAAWLLGMLQGGGDVSPGALTDWAGLADRRLSARLAYAAARGAEHVTHLAHETRHALRGELYDAELNGTPPQVLGQRLLERFAHLARDWRRVALTEVAANRSHGYLAALPVGSVVIWRAASDACPRCRRLHGRRYRVVAPDHPNKDPAQHVWVGKSARGRDTLVYHAIPLHPHCRCRYVGDVAGEARLPGVSSDIAARVKVLLARATRP